MKLKSIIAIVLVILGSIGVGMFFAIQQNETLKITNFEECKAAGYPIMESYPEQCRTSDGKTFTNTVIVQPYLSSFGVPTEFTLNEKIIFEDNLQVTLKEINDSRCKEGVVCIWAGELGFVFEATGGNFEETKYTLNLGTAQIKEKQANGYAFTLQVNNATETIVTIVINKKLIVLGTCYIGGCSGQVCSDQKDMVTTCEYRQEYACYKTAKCERQSDSYCGWTQTAELKSCLGLQ